MITAEEFYINKKVRDKYYLNPKPYQFNLSLINVESRVPLIDFAKESIEEYEQLRLMHSSINDGVDEFIIHSYYYLLDQVLYYESTGLPNQIAVEMAKEDLLGVYANYNTREIKL